MILLADSTEGYLYKQIHIIQTTVFFLVNVLKVISVLVNSLVECGQNRLVDYFSLLFQSHCRLPITLDLGTSISGNSGLANKDH